MNELEAMVADVTALREEVVGTVRLRHDRHDRVGGWCHSSQTS